MTSVDDIRWEGILAEYQLKDPLTLSGRPDGSSVKVSFTGKHATESLHATVQNGMLNGSALIKDRLQRRVLDFVFVNNCITGPYEFYKNGTVISKGTFVNSRRNGEIWEYSRGKIIFHGFYKNDRRDGEAEEYDGTGFPIYKGTYDSGIRTTESYIVTANEVDYLCQFCSETNTFLRGQFDSSSRVFDGLCVEITERNQPIRLLQYSSGKQLRLIKLFSESSVIEYDVNGRVIYEGTYLNDAKLWYPREGYGDEYFEGNLVYSGCFSNGLRDGQGTAYYLDMHVLFNGRWKRGRVDGSGVCICRDGSLFAYGEWKDGQLVTETQEIVLFDEAVRNDEEMNPVFSNVLSYLFQEETQPRSSCVQVHSPAEFVITDILPITELNLDQDDMCDVMILAQGLDKHVTERRNFIISELRTKKKELESRSHEDRAISDGESSSGEEEGNIEVVNCSLPPEEIQRVVKESTHKDQIPKESETPPRKESLDISVIPRFVTSFSSTDLPMSPVPDFPSKYAVKRRNSTESISDTMIDQIPLQSDDLLSCSENPVPSKTDLDEFHTSLIHPSETEKDSTATMPELAPKDVSDFQVPQQPLPSSLESDSDSSEPQHPFPSPQPYNDGQCENSNQPPRLDHSDVSPGFPQPTSPSKHPGSELSEVNTQDLLRSGSERQDNHNEPGSLQQSCFSNDRADLSDTEPTVVWDESCQLFFKGFHSATGLIGRGQILTSDHHILREGMFANNLLNGPGSEYFPYEATCNEFSLAGLPIPTEPIVHLEGNFVDGELEGEGKEYGIDGNVIYFGSFHKGLYEGEGVLYDNVNETMLQGIFKNGHLNGSGKRLTFFEQLIEEGEYGNDVLNGKGIIYYANGQMEYEGEFKEGERYGYGQVFDDQGRLAYQGEWMYGMWKGEGVYYDYEHNLQMEGEFVENRLNGYGCIRFISDQHLLFQGIFQDSILSRGCEFSPRTHLLIREGTYTLNHSRFVGKLYRENGSLWIESIFDNNIPNGATKQYYENGVMEMEGGMRAGVPHGFCIFYYSDGTKRVEAEYDNGKEDGEKTEFDHGLIKWNGIVKNGVREGSGQEYDSNGRIQFKGEYHENKVFEGTETKYMSVEKEQWCFCRTIHNGSYSSQLLIYAIEDESPRELDQSWRCVYQGGWIQDSSSDPACDQAEWLLDGLDIPLRHGQGVFFLPDGRSVQTEWNRDLPDLEKCTVFTTERQGTKLRRSRYTGEILLELFESLLHPLMCYHGKGTFYFEDNSFFLGIWEKGCLQGCQPFIYWNDNTVKYETQIIQVSRDGRFAHEFMPSKQTRYHPKNWNGYIEGIFSQEYNCIQNPIYYYDCSGRLICGPANAQYSMNADGYNVDYGYPRI